MGSRSQGCRWRRGISWASSESRLLHQCALLYGQICHQTCPVMEELGLLLLGRFLDEEIRLLGVLAKATCAESRMRSRLEASEARAPSRRLQHRSSPQARQYRIPAIWTGTQRSQSPFIHSLQNDSGRQLSFPSRPFDRLASPSCFVPWFEHWRWRCF